MNTTDNDHSTNQVVSCIVPVLNEGDAISDFISSLHQQDYKPIELIIVDGGSTDDTIDIVNSSIDKLSDESFSIRLFRECDFGEISSPANARNIGLDAAQGEFIFFIDADTCFIDDATISKAVSEMNDHDFVIIYFKPLIDTKLEYYISKTMKLDGIFLYRRKIIENIRFIPTLGFGEDREFNHRLFGCVTSSKKISSTIFIGRH
ncbi:MAG: glycosyltransferase family 2 protein [Candidatus Heimdallarchaeota archaeon]|nr:glycosyltransferase family 2 protein [Candidatus Heimdallarchaeota archaeon]